MSVIKAIETRYAGCHFRSRLEARWAVFFDALGIPWEYEPQGFEGRYGNYLPDFLLRNVGHYTHKDLWVEVKGSDEQLDADRQRIGGCIDYEETPISDGLLILGPIPRVSATNTYVTHTKARWRKGVETEQVRFVSDVDGRWVVGAMNGHQASFLGANTSEELPSDTTVAARVWNPITWEVDGRTHGYLERVDPRLMAAYNAARSARFEHGESGAT